MKRLTAILIIGPTLILSILIHFAVDDLLNEFDFTLRKWEPIHTPRYIEAGDNAIIAGCRFTGIGIRATGTNILVQNNFFEVPAGHYPSYAFLTISTSMPAVRGNSFMILAEPTDDELMKPVMPVGSNHWRYFDSSGSPTTNPTPASAPAPHPAEPAPSALAPSSAAEPAH
jgi:hypothetical protein